MLDAYAIKKIAPRILLGIIFINLSLYIVVFAAEMTRVVGNGVNDLITAPVKSDLNYTVGNIGLNSSTAVPLIGLGLLVGTQTGRSSAAAAPGAIKGMTTGLFGKNKNPGEGSVLPFLILFVVIPITLIILAIFITIILRQGILILLAMLAPLAFACYLLPSTEKYFKKWWDLFIKTLLVYPIIMVIFAVSDILASIIFKNNGDTISGIIAGVIVMFAPLAMIPFAFKLAGGAIGTIYGTLSGGGKKGVNMLKGDPRNAMSLGNRAKRQAGERAVRSQAAMWDRLKDPNATARQRRIGRLAGRFGDVDTKMARYMAEANEREEMMSKTGRDGLRYAAAGYSVGPGENLREGIQYSMLDGSKVRSTAANPVSFANRRYFDSKGREVTEDYHNEAQRLHGRGMGSAAQNLEYTLRKVQTDNDVANFRESFRRKAIENQWRGNSYNPAAEDQANPGSGVRNYELGDQWAAATYPHKGAMGSEWFSSPYAEYDAAGNMTDVKFKDVSQDPSSFGSMIGEKHKAVQSYQQGAARDIDWRAIAHHQETVQQKIDAGTATQQDLDNYAMANEVTNTVAMSSRMTPEQMRAQGMDPDAAKQMVSGLTPAATGVVEALLTNRVYDTRHAQARDTRGRPDGPVSYHEREVYKKVDPSSSAGVKEVVAGTATVTGDVERSILPK